MGVKGAFQYSRQGVTKDQCLINFEGKFIPEPNSGCWLWGAYCMTNGYGTFCPGNGRRVLAHRASFELYVAPIPEGLLVLHRCDVRCCVNPNHLFLGTQADNIHDMWAKGRGSKPPKKKFGSRRGVLKRTLCAP